MKCRFITLIVMLATFDVGRSLLHAGTIQVPNGSFESPTTTYVRINVDSWQKTPKPDWYVEDGSFLWSQLVGIFKNQQDSTFIDNCDGTQAIWLFAVPEAGFFQDYESVEGTNTVPSHDFDATFQVGKAYRMTVGLLVGRNAGTPMLEGVTLDMSLYYRDALSNRVSVATTVVTNLYSVFTNGNHFLDREVNLPVVKPDDPWAGKHIGIQFISTVISNMQGGYWDLDNVRLVEITPAELTANAWTNNQFHLTLTGETNAVFEILASTNATLSVTNWTALATVTNTTGTVPFVDTSGMFEQRWYQARQLP